MRIANLRAWTLPVAAALSAAALGSAAPARADWVAYGGNPEHSFIAPEKVTAPLGVLWKHATNVYAERIGNRGGAVIQNGVAYYPSKNRILAVDAATGQLRWRSPEGDPNDPAIPQITATPVVSGEMVYVPDAKGYMTAYSTLDGSQVWAFKTDGAVRSSPVLVGSDIFFGSDDDFLYCVNARSGDLKWKSNYQGKEMPLSDDAEGSPVFYAGVIYINSSDMKLWAFQAETGRMLWQQRVANPTMDISPVAFNGRIYLAGGSTMYQFRLRGGNYRAYPMQQWVENDISTTPIITDAAWFFGDRNGYFHAFTPQGKPFMMAEDKPWKVKLEGKPQGTPVMTADTIYVGTDKGFIYGINIARGEITWTYRTEAPKGMVPAYSYYAIRAPLAVSDGKLYVVGDDGTLTCMSPDAPDDEGPVMIAPRPSRGTVTNGAPPIYVAAYLWDEGTGINPNTIEMLVDGQPIEPDKEPYNARVVEQREGWVYDPVRRMVWYTTQTAERGEKEQLLRDGRHKVQVMAADWRGNVNALEWTFIVDNTLPKRATAVKATTATRSNTNPMGGPGLVGQPGAPGGPGAMGYPGGGPGGPGGPGGYPGMGGPGGQFGQQGQFRNRLGGYQYRGRGGYPFGQGGMGGFGGRGGFGGSSGYGGYGGGYGGRRGY